MAWYRWEQSNVVYIQQEELFPYGNYKIWTSNFPNLYYSGGSQIPQFNTSTGLYDLSNVYLPTPMSVSPHYGPIIAFDYSGWGENVSEIYYSYQGLQQSQEGAGASDPVLTKITLSSIPAGSSMTRYYTVPTKSNFVQYVYSTNPNAYPQNEVVNGYWYSNRTELLPAAPGTITVPAVVAGEQVAITWTSAAAAYGSITSYNLERSINGSGWTQIFSGNALTYTDTVGEAWATVAYRVCAIDDAGGASPFTTSQTQVVNAGVLYISGPVNDLGSQTAPFTFSVSVGISGDTAAVSVNLSISMDGEMLYHAAVNTGQTVSLTIDTRIIADGNHTIAVNASAQNYVTTNELYNFVTPSIRLPTGGLGIQLQDNQENPVFPQSVASLIGGMGGKSVAGNLYDLFESLAPKPNLIDNWYLINPVNLSGKNSYTSQAGSVTSCIDRYNISGAGTITLSNDGVSLIPSSPQSMDFFPIIKNYQDFVGEIYTFSALIDGEIYSCTFNLCEEPAGIPFAENSLFYSIPSSPVIIRPNSEINKIEAIKLEQGSKQTFARVGLNGKINLTKVPNYAETLLKCQQYHQILGGRAFGHANYVFVPMPTTMVSNGNPQLILLNGGQTFYGSDTASAVTPTGVSLQYLEQNGIGVQLITSEPLTGEGTQEWADFKLEVVASE